MNNLEYISRRFNLDLSQKQMPVEIPNVNRVTLAKLFGELGFKTGAEIGTEQGLYAEELCRQNLGVKLYCVDPWKAYRGYREHVSQGKLDGFYETTRNRLEGRNVELVRKFSVDAAKDFPDNSLDFVYLDANHEFRHVVDDISEWQRKVRPGGIVSGHDFIRRKNRDYLMGVIHAVIGYTGAYQIKPWFILGRKDRIPGELRDITRSWMWVKE